MSLHPRIEQAARAALNRSATRDTAAADLLRAVQADTKLMAALVLPHIKELCERAIGTVAAMDRAPAEPARREPRPPGWRNDERDAGAAMRALAAGNTAMLLATVLPSGVVLERATRADVSAAADVYEAKATRSGSKARWLRLVAQCIPENKTVGRALDERRLQELRKEADRG